ncbi:MAG TPA: F0F1 ATP synthase subunit B [Chthoniobacterales bacterium]|nr:F0F1 ATP synthase subunit B [Chthoniobacterales bacterium]
MNIAILAAASTGDMIREVGETFGFDLKIFLSQVISFVIVALVLRQFAYKPILAVLEERRQRIAEGLLNAEKIKQQLAEAEQRHADILSKANAQAQKMIDDARESAAHVGERKEQEAIAAAEQIIAKAHEASALERERTMTELKHEIGRLVVDTTAKVTGKVLTPEDQKRLQEEAARQVAS